jgi:creatinine amidohydrolase/Fe(II)-dependent formamide hydrolase-like protein
VSGDPKRASAELGKLGTDLIVQQSVAAIRAATAAPR